MFCAPRLIFDGTEGVGSRFHVLRDRTRFRRYRGRRLPFSCFALPELVFGGIRGVSSRFHGLRARTYFRRFRGRRLPFSCFVLPDSFSAVHWVSSCFAFSDSFSAVHRVSFSCLGARTHFRRCRVRRVVFSCFARPDSFSAIPGASDPVFMFCARRTIYSASSFYYNASNTVCIAEIVI
jgi:hypothetical protein